MSIEAQRALATSDPPEQVPILHVFERALRDVSLPIERAREIYALQREIEADLAEREYLRVRGVMEAEFDPIAKDAANSQTKSRYATLAQVIQAVRPIYSKHGITVSFDTAESEKGEAWVRVLAFVGHVSGYKRTYHIDMPADGKGAQGRDVMTRTHATGSAVTYGRRYLLLMIFNLAVGGEDDDGNAAPNGNGPVSAEQLEIIQSLIVKTGSNIVLFCKFFKIERVEDLPAKRFAEAQSMLERKFKP